MVPLSDACSLSFLLAGITLNIVGIVLGASALVRAHSAYGEGPLIGWLWRGLGKLTAAAGRLDPRTRRTHPTLEVEDAVSVTSSDTVTIDQHWVFPESLSDEELRKRLIAAVQNINAELLSHRAATRDELESLEAQLNTATDKIDSNTDELDQLVRRVAAGDIRLQLAGLLAVGLGTVLLTLPSAWNLIAAGQ